MNARILLDVLFVAVWSVVLGAYLVICLLDPSLKDVVTLTLSVLLVVSHIWKITAGRGTR